MESELSMIDESVPHIHMKKKMIEPQKKKHEEDDVIIRYTTEDHNTKLQKWKKKKKKKENNGGSFISGRRRYITYSWAGVTSVSFRRAVLILSLRKKEACLLNSLKELPMMLLSVFCLNNIDIFSSEELLKITR